MWKTSDCGYDIISTGNLLVDFSDFSLWLYAYNRAMFLNLGR